MLNGISLLHAPSGFSFTGGAATVFQDDSTPVKRGIHVIDVADSSFITRKHATFKTTQPVRQGNGTFSKGRRDINFTIPYLNAVGEVEYATVDINMGLPASIDAATLSALRYYAAQLCLDAEVDPYFSTGTTK
jgi:hypothetical protein